MCDMTHSYMCDMTHSYMCDMTLSHASHNTSTSHVWINHVTHILVCDHVTHMNEKRQIHELACAIMSHERETLDSRTSVSRSWETLDSRTAYTCHVTFTNFTNCRIWIYCDMCLSHTRTSHVTFMNKSCHTHATFTNHINDWCHIKKNVTNESCHTHELRKRLLSHSQIVTNESRYTHELR